MTTLTFHPAYETTVKEKTSQTPIVRFLNWSASEEKNRLGWMCVSVTAMTAIFFPLTMASILLHGAAFALIICAMLSLIVVVIPNLAAQPTKITIPALFIGVAIDLSMVVLSFFL